MKFDRQRFDPGQQGANDASTPVTRNFNATESASSNDASSTYTYSQGLILAVNVALAVGRPLLLSGEPGCGKTTLARNIALVKRWAFYQQNIGSRTQASDLLWEFDALRRLNDANVRNRNVLADAYYVDPGTLWWALAPESAARRGYPGYSSVQDRQPPIDPAEFHAAAKPIPRLIAGVDPQQFALPEHYDPPLHAPELQATPGVVVLLDEIDKAEPDVPNDLLEVLDTRSFSVKGQRVNAERPRDDVLVVITTNKERELPGAFMRRCVVYAFPDPQAGWFAALARQRFSGVSSELIDAAERAFMSHRQEAERLRQRVPGAAEFLDAIAALQRLDIPQAQGHAWAQLERCVFGKQAALDPRN